MKGIWVLQLSMVNYHFIYRLMHAVSLSRNVIIPRDRYEPEGFSPRIDIGQGMITVLKWEKVCINLLITYFNIELKRTKLTSHTYTKLIWIWVIDIWLRDDNSPVMEKVMHWSIYRKAWYRVISFSPNISPWVDIAVALPVFTYRQNWRYY